VSNARKLLAAFFPEPHPYFSDELPFDIRRNELTAWVVAEDDDVGTERLTILCSEIVEDDAAPVVDGFSVWCPHDARFLAEKLTRWADKMEGKGHASR
jgi:hypothetical protein